MAEWIIEPVQARHQHQEFSCGKPPLDTFLRLLVAQYEKRRLGRTFVAVKPGDSRVAGYYTLAAGSFEVASLPTALRKKLPKHPIPTVHIGRLAVDESCRGLRLGETLLFHALHAALELSERPGSFAVDVWAIDEDARRFYEKYGFSVLADNPRHLYLPMKTVEAMFDD